MIALPNHEAKNVAEDGLHNVFATYGVDLELHLDQDLFIESYVWIEMMTIVGIKKSKIMVLLPQLSSSVCPSCWHIEVLKKKRQTIYHPHY